MVLWQMFLGVAAISFVGAGLLQLKRRKDEKSGEQAEVSMPTVSLLGNSAREYNSKEVHLPEPRAASRIAKANREDYQEIPLISVEDLPKNDSSTPSGGGSSEKKNDQDWTPVDFFEDEKEKQ